VLLTDFGASMASNTTIGSNLFSELLCLTTSYEIE
jgi:hypothetical protein